MRIVFDEAKDFIEFVKSAQMIEEAVFRVNDDGLFMRSMDPSRVALLDLRIPRNDFEEFELNDDGLVFGLSMDNFYKFLRRGNGGDSLVLRVDGDDVSVLTLKFKGDYVKTFKVPLRDVDDDEQEMPDLHHSVSMSISAGIIQESIKDAGLVSDSLSFEGDDDVCMFSEGSGQRTETSNIGEKLLTDVDIEGSARSTYALSYLSDVLGVLKRGKDLSVSFGSDMPLKASWGLYGESEVVFVLAPRIDNE